MFLPYNNSFAKSLMKMVHEDKMHCGPSALISHVRQLLWPLKAATVFVSRVTPARPFINVGVDYCGPFWDHFKIRGKKSTKAYMAIFCCLLVYRIP